MEHRLMFGAPVHNQHTQFGTLKRIIINDGIANQITVDPGLLGVERIVPISAVPETSAEGVRLEASEEDWKAFAAFNIHGIFGNSNEDEPTLSVMETAETVGASATSVMGSHDPNESVSNASLVLSAATTVAGAGEAASLKGLIIDTGRPRQLVLDDRTVPYTDVSRFGADRIELGGGAQQSIE